MKFFEYKKDLKKFKGDSLDIGKFYNLASQKIIAPFKLIIKDNGEIKEDFEKKYLVGFIGCEKNEKDEV